MPRFPATPSLCDTIAVLRLDYTADALLHILQKGAELPWLYPPLKQSSLAISWATTFAILLLKRRPVALRCDHYRRGHLWSRPRTGLFFAASVLTKAPAECLRMG